MIDDPDGSSCRGLEDTEDTLGLRGIGVDATIVSLVAEGKGVEIGTGTGGGGRLGVEAFVLILIDDVRGSGMGRLGSATATARGGSMGGIGAGGGKGGARTSASLGLIL